MTDALTLRAGDPWRIEVGDVLAVEPDVGPTYHVRVTAIDGDRLTGRTLDPAAIFPRPPLDRRETFGRDELEAWHASGHLWPAPDYTALGDYRDPRNRPRAGGGA